jgi:hypothetical protein
MDYQSYWEGFAAFWKEHGQGIADYNPTPSDRQYLGFHFGTSEAHFALNAPRKEIRCELVLDDVVNRDAILSELERRQDVIEEALQTPVVIAWRYAGRRLYVFRNDLHPTDASTLYEQYGWMLDKLRLFYAYFPGLLDEITKTPN